MDVRQCEARTQPRRRRGIWGLTHRCLSPVKFRVRPADRFGRPDPTKVAWTGEYVCGRHVRPYLMDNGDSVWKPWIVEPLANGPANDANLGVRSERESGKV